MPNIYWYIGLTVIGASVAAITVCRKRHEYKISTLIILILFSAGLSWICEFIVLGLFDSYFYRTNTSADIWAQNLLGHLLLNTTVYPAATVVTVTSRHRVRLILLSAIIFVLIEFAFVRAGLYEHHWWRYYMTPVGVVIYLLAGIFWFDRMKSGCEGRRRALVYFFAALPIVHMPAPILLLAGKQRYQLKIVNDFFGDPYLSSIVVIFAYSLFECLELVIITCLLKKWYLKLVPFLISITSQCLFSAFGLLVTAGGWHLGYTLILYELVIGIFLIVEDHTLKPAPFRLAY